MMCDIFSIEIYKIISVLHERSNILLFTVQTSQSIHQNLIGYSKTFCTFV